MSSRPRGNIGLMSSDSHRSAADDTDEICLQVLCLTGEGVTACVPRSISGYELRKLLSEKLAYKPGAKLALHHRNQELILDETLGQQGFTAETAIISCTYVPTNLFAAWCYAFKVSNIGGEFVLEGITTIEGAKDGRYLLHLPRSLATLSFNQRFNRSLAQMTLPSRMQHLSFGYDFNQSLQAVTLPSSLKSLSFGCKFNQTLERVTLPRSLSSLSFGDQFN